VRIASNLQRQPLARKLYEQWFTMDQIAEQFGVSRRQIGYDMENLEVTSKLKHTKTERNPKGAGRPHGSGRKAPSRHPRADAEVAAAQRFQYCGTYQEGGLHTVSMLIMTDGHNTSPNHLLSMRTAVCTSARY
jgi:hypothetical protein